MALRPTPLQRGMLFDSILAEHRGVHVVQIVVEGSFDHDRIASAWNETIARHDALRMSFAWEGRDEPELIVHDRASIAIERTDRASAVRERTARPLDPSIAPVMRLALAGDALVWTLHHALLDGRSFAIVLSEVFARYDGRSVEPAPIPFADHLRAVAALDRDLAREHWERTLRGASRTGLALVGPDSARAAHREVHHHVPRAVADAIERADLRLNAFVHAAWALLLARHNRTDDVVFAATRAGRHLVPGSERSVGCFINTLPVRVHVDPAESGRALIERVRRAHLEVRPFEESAASDVRRWSGADAKQPLAATHVVFERQPLARALGDAAERTVSVHEQGSFPITLAAYRDDGLALSLEHDEGACSEENARGVLEQLAHLMARIAADLDAPAGAHPLLDDASARRVIARTNVAPAVSAPPSFVHAFARTLERSPDAEALADVGRRFTYRALEGHANRVARELAERGVQRGDVVALAMGRCAEWAISMLAVAKCGAAFLPIDPDLPEEVRRYMREDAGVRVVLAPEDVVLRGEPGAPLDRTIAPGDLAYVLYTSGSTGRPKGVAIEHGALAAHDAAFAELIALRPEDRALQFTSVSFDVSIEEVTPTWMAGGAVVLRTPEMSRSIEAFLDGIARERVTIANLPSGFFHELVHATRRDARLPSSVRVVLAGGEKVLISDYLAFRARHPHVRFLDAYGPTEATITATAFDPAGVDLNGASSMPIGKPLASARAYVLEGPHVAPIGVPGELYLGGPAIARGYLGKPELTAERFVPDPRGGRMYATGDLARVLPSGDLELLGRLDHQVKIRGHRIELEGIERALEEHPRVRRAACALHMEPAPRIVAYVVADGAEDLRAWLAARLPAYALPSAIVALDRLPETATGKIDRPALPRPAEDRARAREASTKTEHDLIEVWSSVLGRRDIGIDDDFFELGGDSLAAIRLVDRIAARLGRPVDLAEVVSARTIAELASVLDRRVSMLPPASRCVVPIQPLGVRPPLFGVHVLGAAWSYYRPLSRHLGPDQPIYGIGYPFRDRGDHPTRVEDVARIYLDELTAMRPRGPYLLCGVSLGGIVAFEMGRQLGERGEDVTLIFFDVLSPEGMEGVGVIGRAARHAARVRDEGPGYVTARLGRRARDLVAKARYSAVRARKLFGMDVPDEERVFAVESENMELAEAYDARPAPVRIVQMRATDDVFYTDEYGRSGLGWRSRALRGLEVIDVPGEHLSILAEPHVAVLAARVRSVVDRIA